MVNSKKERPEEILDKNINNTSFVVNEIPSIEKKLENKVDAMVESTTKEIKEEDQKDIKTVNVINGPVGEVLKFIETLPDGYIVNNIIKAPTTLRKNGPVTSLVFVEKNSNYSTVIVHSKDFNSVAEEANKEIENGAIVLDAYASPSSSRKRGRVAFEIIIILKKRK